MRDYISDSLFPYFEKAGILLRFKEKEQIYFQGDYAKDFILSKKVKSVFTYSIATDMN